MASIEVLSGGFCSAQTNERVIHPGVYEVNDPRIFGLAEFLVDQGRAEWVVPLPERVPAQPQDDGEGENTPKGKTARWTAFGDEVEMPADYADASKDELLREVKSRDIPMPEGGGSGSTGNYLVADLIDMLLADDDA